MNEKLLTRVRDAAETALEPSEPVLAAIRGDLSVNARISTHAGNAIGTMLGRRKLRQAFEEQGLPLPLFFILAVTATRLVVFQTGTGARPKRFVGAVPRGTVIGLRLGQTFALMRYADVMLSSGAALPLRLVRKDDPEAFAGLVAGVQPAAHADGRQASS